MMIRRRFFAAVAGAPFLPFSPRLAALLPVAAAPAFDLRGSRVLAEYQQATPPGWVPGRRIAESVEVEVRVDTIQPRALLAALRKEIEEIEETDALLFSAQSRQARVLR